jgi:hypothetical protein
MDSIFVSLRNDECWRSWEVDSIHHQFTVKDTFHVGEFVQFKVDSFSPMTSIICLNPFVCANDTFLFSCSFANQLCSLFENPSNNHFIAEIKSKNRISQGGNPGVDFSLDRMQDFPNCESKCSLQVLTGGTMLWALEFSQTDRT